MRHLTADETTELRQLIWKLKDKYGKITRDVTRRHKDDVSFEVDGDYLFYLIQYMEGNI